LCRFASSDGRPTLATSVAVVVKGEGVSWNIKIEMVYSFDNALYAGTSNFDTGMEIWRSLDGENWMQVNEDGFNGNNTGTLWSSDTAVYQNTLYVGTRNRTDGGEVWALPPTYTVFLPVIIR
jgi:hypothetical protein